MKPVALLVLPFLALAFAGCGKGSFSEQSKGGRTDKIFRYPIVTNPTTLDPGVVQDGDTIDMIQQVFQGLVMWGEDNTVVPALAEKWTVSPDGRTYTFTLRKGVKFTNGREVTADDFKWCIERACNPKFNSPVARTYLSDIVGVTDRLDGKAEQVTGYKVVDPGTIAITIDKARPYFLGKLTYAASFVYAKEAVKDPLKEFSSIEEAIGTGPFKYAKYAPEQLVALDANKEYWDGAPGIEGIERPVVKDPETRLNMYKKGDIDLVQLERSDVAGLQKDETLKTHLQFFDRPSLWYIGLNLDIYPALKDKRVRQAFAMAIDKDEIVNQVLGGVNKRADGIVPPGVFGYRADAKGLPFDVAKAKALLAEAGYPDGKGIPALDMFFREQRTDIKLVAEAVAAQLQKNLGVNVKLNSMEWRAYLEKHNAKKQPFFHMRWAADYLDAENFLSTLLATYGPENKVNYSNPTYDALCKKADTSLDPEERKKLYAQAEDIVLQDAPFIPIYIQRDAELIRPRVKGMRNSLFGHLPHTKLSLD
ncbi:MAG: peptide ABC transporter substrate-binding protein [Fimbriimonas sp.]